MSAPYAVPQEDPRLVIEYVLPRESFSMLFAELTIAAHLAMELVRALGAGPLSPPMAARAPVIRSGARHLRIRQLALDLDIAGDLDIARANDLLGEVRHALARFDGMHLDARTAGCIAGAHAELAAMGEPRTLPDLRRRARRLARHLDGARRSAFRAPAPAVPPVAVSRSARTAIDLAVRALPPAARERYAEELLGELCGLSRREQIREALSLLVHAHGLRRELAGGREPRRPGWARAALVAGGGLGLGAAALLHPSLAGALGVALAAGEIIHRMVRSRDGAP